MRLIECREMRMEEFVGDDIPPYAILSHTWGKEEVTYRDFGTEEAKARAGWDKIQQTCKIALAEGIGHAWVDTCCIDKSSSAELTEAINSMYQWNDWPRVGGSLGGWTLQELIAPQSVIFFNRNWFRVGDKEDTSHMISKVTGIPPVALNLPDETLEGSLESFPICQKMSWASGRKTTRVEDAAYCLTGLFDVNMPLLYSEGHKAFIRFQEEIMRRSNDMSIFAWRATTSEYEDETETDQIMGLLAKSPDAFADSKFNFTRVNTFGQEFSLTNRGIRVSGENVTTNVDEDDSVLYVSEGRALQSRRGWDYSELLGVVIEPIGGGLFVRSQPEVPLKRYPARNRFISPAANIFLVTELTSKVRDAHGRVNHETIRVPWLSDLKLYRTGVFPRLQYQYGSNCFITQGFDPAVGYATYKSRRPRTLEDRWHIDELVVFIGLTRDGYREPWCSINSPNHYPAWSNERWVQEDNIKRHWPVAYREREKRTARCRATVLPVRLEVRQ